MFLLAPWRWCCKVEMRLWGLEHDGDEPLNIVFTVIKYVPMGSVIMANVKPNSLKMTALWQR